MSRLTYQLEQEILDNLDHVKDKLHQNVCDFEDSVWMVGVINKLLAETHLMRSRIIESCKEED